MQSQPFQIKSTLAPTPKTKNQWLLPVTDNNAKANQTLTCADPRAIRALVALMDMHAQLGGAASHFGGPSALAELASALFAIMFNESEKKAQEWHDLFHFVNDAGHCENAFYALKAIYEFGGLHFNDLKKFRSIDSPLTGHGEAHVYPEGVLISNGPLGSAMPQSQGLAMADKKAQKQRTTICLISDGACMEGEVKEALASIPGLAQKSLLNPYVLIVSDNDTKLSGRISSDSFSMKGSFDSLKILGWRVLELPNGHSLTACLETLNKAIDLARSNPEVPIAIHAKTIKGFGSKACAESPSGGHGFPLKKANELLPFLQEIYDSYSFDSGLGPFTQGGPAVLKKWCEDLVSKSSAGESLQAQTQAQSQSLLQPQNDGWTSKLKSLPKEKIQVGISQAMIEGREKGLPVVSITSDLPGSTGVAGFRKKFPQDSFDMGVAEANMVSVAAGFSRSGFIPVVDTFAQFGVTKGALPLTMANLSLAPMICVYSHTGFQDAADGASHQALSYLAMTMSLPHTQVFCLSSSSEAYHLLTEAMEEFATQRAKGKTPDTYVFFLGREDFPKKFSEDSLNLCHGYLLHKNLLTKNNVTIVTSGSLVSEALKAADELASKGIGTMIVNSPNVKYPDTELISNCLKETNGYLFTLEDHQVIGGAGQRLFAALANDRVSFKGTNFGIKGQFGRSAHTALELYQLHKIDSKSVAQAITQFLS